jgi:hypothetical protein
MSNRDELLKIQQSWELEQARRDSLRLPGISITDPDSSDAKVDTLYQGSSAFSEMPKISGIGEGSLLDYIGKGIMYSGQAEQARSQVAIEAGKAAAETLQPVVEPIVEGVKSITGDILTGDYQRSVIAGAVGMPVDVANELLALLGIEMTYSDKPFMGSKHIKESLDYMSGAPYSTRFRPK